MLDRRMFCRTVGQGAAAAWAASLTTAAARRPTPAAAAGAPIRIGSNENPFGPPAAVTAAIGTAAAEAHRYPGQSVGQLMTALSGRLEVPTSQLVLACGSGDILRAAVAAFTSPSRPLVTAAPTFEGPSRHAEALGTPIHAVPVTSDLTLDLRAMAEAAVGAGLVFVCNPNNPTGTVVPSAAVTELVERVAQQSPETMVLVDEAYFEYVDRDDYQTAVPLAARLGNVVVSRTFSKIYGMAGLRVGYAVASPAAAASFRRFLSPGSLGGISVAAAIAALAEADRPAIERARNRETRAAVQRRFEQAGYRVAPSQANFVLVDIRREVGAFQIACRQRGVLVARPFPPLTTWARVTIGTPDEMDRAMPLLLDVLASPAQTADARHLAIPVAEFAC